MVLRVVFLVLVVAAAGCRHVRETPVFRETKDVAPIATTGPAARNPTGTLTSYLLHWETLDRTHLESQLKTGSVAVLRYDGCEITAVPGCSVPESYAYQYTPVSHKSDSEAIEIEHDLNASLRPGGSHYQKSKQIEVRIIGVRNSGIYRMKRDELTGSNCDHATHIASTLFVGAFGVGENARRDQYNADSSSTSDNSRHQNDGELAACKAAKETDIAPPHHCGGIMAIKIVALDGESTPASRCSQRGPAGAMDSNEDLPGVRPWRGLAAAGGLSLGASAAMATMGAIGVIRSKSLEQEHERACAFPGDPSSNCSDLDRRGALANRIQLSGLIMAPALLATGVALIVVALKRKNYRQQAFAPLFDKHTAGLSWKVDF